LLRSAVFIPVWESSSSTPAGMDEIGAYTHLFLLPFAVLLVVSLPVYYLLFGKRKLQMRFCTANILLSVFRARFIFSYSRKIMYSQIFMLMS
jgi:hypothetical protein